MNIAAKAAVALLVVIGSGLVHGQWTGRWGNGRAIEEAVARLENVPMTVGDWVGQPVAADRRQMEQAEIAGYLVRRYRRGNEEVMVLLVCGRPGPIALHPPDICYTSSGFGLAQTPGRVRVRPETGATAEFLTAPFLKQGAITPEGLRIYWAWSDSGAWQTPTSPRWEFARAAALYKLYVLRSFTGVEDQPAGADDPCQEFLQDFLPRVEAALSPGTTPGTKRAEGGPSVAATPR